jgi:hypothetical protein
MPAAASTASRLLVLLAPALLLASGSEACSRQQRKGPQDGGVVQGARHKSEQEREAEQELLEQERERERMDKQFPLYGLVTGLQLTVREQPDPAATQVGWLRLGSRIRLAPGPRKSPTCNTGWYRVRPLGWACAGEGIEVAEQPPRPVADASVSPEKGVLPYSYYFVKEQLVPEYYRLPSRDEQRAALGYAARFLELKRDNEKKAERFSKGELPGEPGKPAVVFQYLERGFFVAGVGIEIRAFRRFVRTVRGRYIKQRKRVYRG